MTVDLSGGEYMGIFGFSWEEKVGSFMKKALQGTAAAKKMSSFFQAGGVNVSLVKNLANEYLALMARGYRPANFTAPPDSNGSGGTFDSSTISLAGMLSNKTNVDAAVSLAFLRALFVLSRDGKIPFAKWNPQGYKESTTLRKTFSTEKGILEKVSPVANYGKIALIVAGIGTAAYFLSQLNAVKRRVTPAEGA